MTGKQHCAIGTTVGVIGSYAYLGGNLSPANLATIAVPVVAGAFIGSYAPDIDSKKSKASQVFNKIVLTLVLALGVGFYLQLPIMDKVLSVVKEGALGNIGLLIFIANLVLGKLSGHRLYTHRWIGTLVAIGSAYIAFNKAFAIGFAVGYLLHILADRTTADGKHLKFFRIQLPMTNSKGRFHVSF